MVNPCSNNKVKARDIPFASFDKIHQEFHGDTWEICRFCGGKCEINKIGALMPGEAEYIASKMNYEIGRFRDQFLDGLLTPYGYVDVLKLKPTCPFLSETFQCSIKDFKPVLCAVYPLVFKVEDEQVEFFLDDWCPMVQCHGPVKYFKEKGIAPLKALPVDLEWWRAVETFDGLCVDYHKIFALRATQPNYVIMTLDQILTCEVEQDAPPELLVPKSSDSESYPDDLSSRHTA
jgi:Fe-S-cluster containining protein